MTKVTLTAEPGKQEIIITRLFDAPADRLFKAMSDPSLIPNWWGPRKYITIVDKMDFKEGGSWRFINRESDGTDYAFHGVYHSIAAPTRMVQTFEWEGMPGHVSLETMTLEERNGQTLLTSHAVFQSVADRDGMMQGGMEEGVNDTYDRLAEVVARA
jgi:uncharacterized protein YndB with AHSA1/START domain